MELTPKSEEFAKTLSWEPQIDSGAPMPLVFSDGSKVIISYILEDDLNKNGLDIVDLYETNGWSDHYALVEFVSSSFKFGIANDEVFSGLPWWKKKEPGLHFAYTIENSVWLNQIKTIHKVHPYYNEAKWVNKKHIVLLFKDEIFEVITTGYTVELFKADRNQILTEMLGRLK